MGKRRKESERSDPDKNSSEGAVVSLHASPLPRQQNRWGEKGHAGHAYKQGASIEITYQTQKWPLGRNEWERGAARDKSKEGRGSHLDVGVADHVHRLVQESWRLRTLLARPVF